MDFIDDPDLLDVMKEETTRGTKHPKKAVTLDERRRLIKMYRYIAERDCTEEEVARALRALGMKTTDDRYQKILKAWKDFSGR